MRTKPSGERIAICLFLTLTGCRHASVHDDPNWPSPGPVDVASLPPIHSVINHGTTDPDALLASRENSRPQGPTQPSQVPPAASPVVLGPLKPNPPGHSAESPPPETSLATVPNDRTGTAGATTAADSQNTFAATDTPPASPAWPDSPPPAGAAAPGPARDDALRPTQATGAAVPPPPAFPSAEATGTAPASTPHGNGAGTANLPPPATKETSQDLSGAPPKEIDFEGLPATAVSVGRVAAKVGREIITVYDLNVAIQEFIREKVPPGQSVSRRDTMIIAPLVLNQMIDRILIVQEAHRLMKSEKQKEALFKQIDQVWQEQQVPPLLKKYKVDTPYELDQVLKKQGRSLDSARQEFMDDAVAHEFMGMKLGSKVHVSLVDMRRYYNENLREFDRPAQLTWREIRIPLTPGSEAAAKAEAEKVLAEARAHSDFATLAKRHGKGPTADQGGLWETSPGAFAEPEVNQMLEKLEPGQISDIITTSRALFVVKLEARREAGPARFDEVQTEIRKKIADEKLAQAASGYLKELRQATIIHTIFDDMPDPRAAMRDLQLKQTSGVAPPASPQSPGANVLPSPQSNPLPASQAAQTDLPTGSLQNLNPAGPLPPRGVMSGPAAPPL